MHLMQYSWACRSSDSSSVRRVKSSWVASLTIFFKDFSSLSFSRGGTATMPNPRPCSVSTITRSSKFTARALLLKSYILPAVLNLTPVTVTIKLASLLKVPISCCITFMFCRRLRLGVEARSAHGCYSNKDKERKKRSRVNLVPLLDASLFSVS